MNIRIELLNTIGLAVSLFHYIFDIDFFDYFRIAIKLGKWSTRIVFGRESKTKKIKFLIG